MDYKIGKQAQSSRSWFHKLKELKGRPVVLLMLSGYALWQAAHPAGSLNGSTGPRVPKTHLRESVECPVLVGTEFSGSGDAPVGHNPLRISSRRRSLCLILSHLLSHLTTDFQGLIAQPFCGRLVLVLSWFSAVPAPLPGRCCCAWHLCLAGRAGRWWHHGSPGWQCCCHCPSHEPSPAASTERSRHPRLLCFFPCVSLWCLSGEQEQP